MRRLLKYKHKYTSHLLILFLAVTLFIAIYGVYYKTKGDSFSNIQGEAVKGYILKNELGEQVDVEDNTLKIGVITPLTGEHFFIGKDTQQGLDLAKQVIAEKKLIPGYFEIIYKDSSCKPENVIQAARALEREKVDFIIGSDCYGYSEYYSFAGEENKDLIMLITPMNPEIKYDRFFSFESGIQDEIDYFLKNVKAVPKTLSIIFIYDDFGKEYESRLKTAYSGRVLSSYSYTFDKTDYADVTEKIIERNPESVFIAGEKESDVLKIILELRRAGYLNQIYTNVLIKQDSLNELGTREFDFEGTLIISDFNPASESIKTASFVKEYSARYNEIPSSYAANAYDIMLLLAEIIDKYGVKNTNEISEILYNIKNYEGVTGLMSFNINNIDKNYYLLQINNGRIVTY